MNPPKVNDEAHINFLIATPKACSAPEVARVHPAPGAIHGPGGPAIRAAVTIPVLSDYAKVCWAACSPPWPERQPAAAC